MSPTTRSLTAVSATVVGVLALLAGSLGQRAAAAEAEVRETVDVRLVTVDVWVTDRDGNPAKNLEAADFEVLEDGKPVSVAHFVELDGAIQRRLPGAASGKARGGEPEDVAAPAVPGHLIVYLDRSRMRPSSYQRVLAELADLLASEEIAAGDVLLLQQDRGLSIVSGFGSTRQELGNAIAHLTREAAGGADLDNDVQLALDAIRTTWEQGRDMAGSATDVLSSIPGADSGSGGLGGAGGSPRDVVSSRGGDLGSGPDACRTFYSQIQPILDAWARDRVQRVAVTLANLSEIATSLAGLPGVKTLLYFSDGLETRPGTALAVYASGLCPGRGASLLNNARANDMTAAFLELTRHAASNRVTIHAVEASGLRSTRFGDASAGRGAGEAGGGIRAQGRFESARRSGEREGLRLLAHETGGSSVLDRNELGPELRRIVGLAGTHYSLAYEPARDGSGDEGRDHRIEVRVRDGSLTTRYRRGYLEKDPETWMTERVLGALNLGLADNPLEARLGAGQVHEAAGGGYRFPLHVMVPVERLAFAGPAEPRIAEIQVAVLARHLETGAVARLDRSFRIQGAPGAGGLADLPIELELEAGVYVTAVGVRDRTSREASFISTTLQVGGDG